MNQTILTNQIEQSLVTLIMPVRNESPYIENSLNSLLAQVYPSDKLEILVCDGRSTDDTRFKISDIIKKNPNHHIYIIDNPQMTMAAGFNAALRQAKGEIIIMVSGHCNLTVDYVKKCTEVLTKTGADCVGGSIVTKGVTRMARAISLAQSSRFGVGGVAFRMPVTQGQYVDTVAFGAYRRQVFEQIGCLDEELVRNQDDEFNFRLTQAGGKIWLDPTIHSIYYSRAQLPKLWRQYFEYGLYKIRVIQKRRAVPSWRHIVPGIFVFILLFSTLFIFLTQNTVWFGLVIIPYLIANIIASIWAARKDQEILLFLPVIFSVLHFSYGLGFLYGLWRWRQYYFAK